ncbi:MAG TPA: sugar kinase [Puia sp.]|nr:sugar kinase [Puia sp.]
MNKKVLSFGELLLRICPDAGGAWLKENTLPFYVGGAEANVATALALWGIPSAYCTALPDHLLSHQLVAGLKEKGVDTSRILFQGQRLGLYYLPKGKDLKNAGVIYDREHSSFWCLQPGTIDWDGVLHDIGWLHFSAISPALNARVARVCDELLQAAVKRNITISVDLNYRSKLWQYGSQPTDIMPNLVQHCDMVMGNLWAAEKMLGIPVDAKLTEGPKQDYLEHARLSSERILHAFPRVRWVAKTFRFDHGTGGIRYYTTFHDGRKLYDSREYVSESILDKVGSGDCFMAGLIYGLWLDKPVQETLEFATAAAYQKLFIPSDATDQRAEEITQFMTTYER